MTYLTKFLGIVGLLAGLTFNSYSQVTLKTDDGYDVYNSKNQRITRLINKDSEHFHINLYEYNLQGDLIKETRILSNEEKDIIEYPSGKFPQELIRESFIK